MKKLKKITALGLLIILTFGTINTAFAQKSNEMIDKIKIETTSTEDKSVTRPSETTPIVANPTETKQVSIVKIITI